MKSKNNFILPLVIMIIGYAIASVQEAQLPMVILFCGSIVVAWLCGQHTTYMINEEAKPKRQIDSFVCPGDIIEIIHVEELIIVTVLEIKVVKNGYYSPTDFVVWIKFRDHKNPNDDNSSAMTTTHFKYVRHIS